MACFLELLSLRKKYTSRTLEFCRFQMLQPYVFPMMQLRCKLLPLIYVVLIKYSNFEI